LDLVTFIALVCLIAFTLSGLRPRRRLALLALTSRLIAIALITLLSLTLLALSGRLSPVALALLGLALFPPLSLTALLIRLAALLP
jgi:hypothetical protein